MTSHFPVHPSITVHEGTTIYRTKKWWKAAIRHGGGSSSDAIAIYLWNRDGDSWIRKNKYQVRAAEAWQSDCQLVQKYLNQNGLTVSTQGAFPISDYYNIIEGETVFQTDQWWKAIVAIDEKGSYETHEVFIYLWQQRDGEWRRRQKYAIKNEADWEEDKKAVASLFEDDIIPTQSSIHSFTRQTQKVETGDDDLINGKGRMVLNQIQSEIRSLHIGE